MHVSAILITVLSSLSAPQGDDVAALKARIADLEKALAAGSAASGARRAESAGPAPQVIGTDAWRDAGLRAKAGAGDAAKVTELLALIEPKAGGALLAEIEKLITGGDAGFATLYDFCLALDARGEQAYRLIAEYKLSFALSHVIMLHEEDCIRFAHYVFAAAKDATESFARNIVFGYVTVALRFRRGKYPDLERDLVDDILRKLRERKTDLAPVYSAMQTLEYDPPTKLMEELLSIATTVADATPPIESLERRNSDEAARSLIRVVEMRKQARDPRVNLIYSALGRMTNPVAETALMRALKSANRDTRTAAALAYFSTPRGEEAVQVAIDYLNIPADERQKRLVVARMYQMNPIVLDGVKLQIHKVQDDAVQDIIFANGQVDYRAKDAKK